MDEKTIEELRYLIDQKKYRHLREIFEQFPEVDIVSFMEELPLSQTITVFRTLNKEMAAEVFAYMDSDMQAHIVNSITDREISEIIADLFVDDAVDFLEEMPASVVRRVLQNADAETRELINQFLQYPENSAGSIMTAEFVHLHKSMTVADAILRIRRTGIEKETVYTCYVTDENRHLEGIVSVKTLLISDDRDIIMDIMETDYLSATTTEDREDVAKMFSKYGLLSLPVVDNENRLVGIVTVDDAVDVIEQEATEDFEKMAAMLPSEKPYLKTGVFELARNRFVWLIVLMVSAMVTGAVLQSYEAAVAAVPALFTFIPMLTDTGGNAGSQSATMIIRGLAISEIRMSDFFRVVWKELRVSLLVGVLLSAVNFVRVLLTYGQDPDKIMLSLTVSVTLLCTVVVAKVVGGILPLVAKFLRADPAVMASPIITTLVDAFSLVLYFTLSQIFLVHRFAGG